MLNPGTIKKSCYFLLFKKSTFKTEPALFSTQLKVFGGAVVSPATNLIGKIIPEYCDVPLIFCCASPFVRFMYSYYFLGFKFLFLG